jgi:cysteine desulfurase family protein (TIGR01976 family)
MTVTLHGGFSPKLRCTRDGLSIKHKSKQEYTYQISIQKSHQDHTMTLNLPQIRAQFPALKRDAIFLDNPAGTQLAQQVLDRMNQYLVEMNANVHGAFATSRESDAMIEEARGACADFLGAARAEEIVFGPNMTSLTFNLSRSLGRWLEFGDEIVVTRLDHDANITPWALVAQDRGCKVRWVDFDVEDGALRMDTLEAALESKPKLVAVGYASNALGTINPVKKITQMAQEVGALVFIDAVQYAPHGPIDVQEIGCDFLTCSSYKFFGPHMGLLYGKYDLLEALKAYKVRPAEDTPPDKFETGTKSHEGIAGVLGALEYLAWVGREFGGDYEDKYAGRYSGRGLQLKKAMAAIRAYEYEVSRALLEVFENTPGVRLYGPSDPRQLEGRVPTFAIRAGEQHPRRTAELLGEAGIYVWDGNYYALAVTERLGVEDTGGMVRVGPAHYNTLEEMARFGEALKNLTLRR